VSRTRTSKTRVAASSQAREAAASRTARRALRGKEGYVLLRGAHCRAVPGTVSLQARGASSSGRAGPVARRPGLARSGPEAGAVPGGRAAGQLLEGGAERRQRAVAGHAGDLGYRGISGGELLDRADPHPAPALPAAVNRTRSRCQQAGQANPDNG
jgi:hypothetical protein